MKTNIQVQFGENSVDVKDIEKVVKEDLKEKEVILNRLDTLDIYYKPENSDIYYVAKAKDNKEYKNTEALKVVKD